MSIFGYASGGVDQIGGDIILPDTLTHLPRFQGENFTLPPGLAITGGRKFIWELNKDYTGVIGITNPESETPTINFDAEAFSEPFVEVRCRIKGQPLNFIVYFIYTSLSTTYKAGATVYSSITTTGYDIEDSSFTIDNSILIEADYTKEIQSNLILFWKAPPIGSNFVKHYKVERWGNGWEYLGTTTRPSYIIPKQEVTYRITPVYNLYSPGIEEPFVIPVLLEGIMSKDILQLQQDSFSYPINAAQPLNTDIFYTVFKTREYESSSQIYQAEFSYDGLTQSNLQNEDTFWTQVINYNDNISSLQITQRHFSYNNIQQSTETYDEVFWSKGIGI